MGWLSLCVCATKSDDEKSKKKNEKHKRKSKKPKKHSEQKKESDKVPSLSVDESLRKSQDDKQIENEEIAEKKWMNGEVVDRVRSHHINDQIDPKIADDSPNNFWSHRSGDSRENFEESCRKNSADERNILRDIDCDYNTMHLICASSTADDEDEKRVKCITDEKEHEEETNLDESTSRSAVSGEPEDSSWTSEVEDRRDVAGESSLDKKLEERISSRINFPNKGQKRQSFKGGTSLKKQSKNALPPIKRKSETRSFIYGEEGVKGHEKMNKFAFENDALFCEQSEIRRNLNSCSFEIRTFENVERGDKKMRGAGSMIPRLLSPIQGMNSIKRDDGGKSEIVQNGISQIAHKLLNKYT